MKAPVNQAEVARAHMNAARVSGIRLGADLGKALAPSFHPSLVDYWNFKGKSNADIDRDTVKGLLGNILTAYNFGWSLGSGYGGYGTDFKAQWNSYDASYGSIIDGRTAHTGKAGSGLYVIACGNRKVFAGSFQGRITGMPEGYSLYIGYASYLHLVTSGNGDFTVNKSDIPGDAVLDGQSIVVNGGFKIMKTGNLGGGQEVPYDITIELMPDYPGAIVSDGVDDYLKFDKTGYKIGTVIVKHIPLNLIDDNWRPVFCINYPKKSFHYGYVNKEVYTNMSTVINTGGYLALTPMDSMPIDTSVLCIAALGELTANRLSMALYEIAIYQDILTDTEIQKEIIKMQSL